MKLAGETAIAAGSLGRRVFPRGYYCYVGSARKNLTARIDRHRRPRKRMHWHIDYLRAHSEVVAAFPIRTQDRIECSLAESMAALSDWVVPGFGCSDCSCESHLFGFSDDPRKRMGFIDALLWWRMNRLVVA
jgi:sugar fermentation stimulation protein A